MIFYFSGTGNSKWIAEELSKGLQEEIMNIADIPKEKTYTFDSSQRIGIVFPIYAWDAPEFVLEFMKRITTHDTYTFAVCTCGDDAGYAMNRVSKVLPLNSGYSISMPSNYIVGFDVDRESVIHKKIKEARVRLKKICKDVEQKKSRFVVTKGRFPLIKTYVASFLFNKFARATKPFYAKKELCNGCGLCSKVCPAKTIHMADSLPVWNKECYQCMACINRCPQKAIEYGKSTLNKGRYYFKF